MARKRQARRCSARRTDGQPCRAYAITGGTVCAACGGSAPAVRAAAQLRYWEARMTYAFNLEWERQGREQLDFQARRFMAAADILGIDVGDVTPADLLMLAIEGKIPYEFEAPKIRVGRRYGPRTRAQLAIRAARQAARKAARPMEVPPSA